MDSWQNCYDSGWQGEIVPEAFTHPAKISRALIGRIYEHAFAEGWLRPGDHIVDCFGGICGTGLDALWNGLHYTAVELEPKFVMLGQQNLDLWQRKYGSKTNFGSAQVVQGDSRQLASVIRSAECVISSPPFLETNTGGRQFGPSQVVSKNSDRTWVKKWEDGGRTEDVSSYGDSPGQLGAMKEGEPPRVDCVVSSPPFSHPNEQPVASQSRLLKEGGYAAMKAPSKMARGVSAGNLESMPEGKFDAVISSPPYAGSAIEKNSGGIDRTKQYETYCAQGGGASFEKFCATQEKHSHPYGAEAGQLGALSEGRFDAVVSSPPFSEDHPRQVQLRAGWNNRGGDGFLKAQGFAKTHGNIAKEQGDTFWQAAREIVAQCHAILRPGGHAIWICKDFVRKGKRVPFSDQWQQLCEAQGFKLVCRHRAMLVAYHGEHGDLFREPKQLKTERKSFFRRLAEKKGSPVIDFEDVICFERMGQEA